MRKRLTTRFFPDMPPGLEYRLVMGAVCDDGHQGDESLDSNTSAVCDSVQVSII
jgi:hypothetical protein